MNASTSTFTGFNDLDDLETAATKKTDTRQKFPCTACGGSGKYQHVRIHQPKTHCFACRGKGHFLTSPEQRAKNRNNAQVNKYKKLKAKILAFKADNAELCEYLESVVSWNSFARSLLSDINDRGSLTDNQLSAAIKMKIKADEKKNKPAEKKPTIDLTTIHSLFNTARFNGLKKPKLRIAAITLSLAPSHGANAGCIYVKSDGEYQGKLTQAGQFYAIRGASPTVAADLQALAGNPLDQAVAYGKRTGNCACCGRELTKHESIERGIGPVCAAKWGF